MVDAVSEVINPAEDLRRVPPPEVSIDCVVTVGSSACCGGSDGTVAMVAKMCPDDRRSTLDALKSGGVAVVMAPRAAPSEPPSVAVGLSLDRA